MKQLTRAFTLIELLIVVAIIAILAAIAVPNFMEAQVRSKVSRVKADLRAMMTAQEMYRLDNNEYIPDNYPNQHTGGINNDVGSFNFLTTPISYMSSVPRSPFKEYLNVDKSFYFQYWRGGYDGTTLRLDEGSRETGILYRITSTGPDNVPQYGSGYSNNPYEIQRKTPAFINGLYDPTNGTKSAGDMIVSNQGYYNN